MVEDAVKDGGGEGGIVVEDGWPVLEGLVGAQDNGRLEADAEAGNGGGVTNTAKATGTTGQATLLPAAPLPEVARTRVPKLVLAGDNPGVSESTADPPADVQVSATDGSPAAISAAGVKGNDTAGGDSQQGSDKAGDGTRTHNSQLGSLSETVCLAAQKPLVSRGS